MSKQVHVGSRTTGLKVGLVDAKAYLLLTEDQSMSKVAIQSIMRQSIISPPSLNPLGKIRWVRLLARTRCK